MMGTFISSAGLGLAASLVALSALTIAERIKQAGQVRRIAEDRHRDAQYH